jgi:tRNA-splicing ligase RtcB
MEDFPSIPATSFKGKRFINAIYGATNYGFVNRMVITEAIRKCVREVVGDRVKLELLYDVSHNIIQQEVHNGESLWIHRSGACRAFPPEMMKSHPLFSLVGQPIPIPGSMGSASYICVGAEGAKDTFFSAPHGAGRMYEQPEAENLFEHQSIYQEMNSKSIKLFKFGFDNLGKHAPGLYKEIDEVIDVLRHHNIVKPVVKLHPLAVLKG